MCFFSVLSKCWFCVYLFSLLPEVCQVGDVGMCYLTHAYVSVSSLVTVAVCMSDYLKLPCCRIRVWLFWWKLCSRQQACRWWFTTVRQKLIINLQAKLKHGFFVSNRHNTTDWSEMLPTYVFGVFRVGGKSQVLTHYFIAVILKMQFP